MTSAYGSNFTFHSDQLKGRDLTTLHIFKNKLCLSIYFWLHWVFISVLRLFLVAECKGSSLVVVHGLLTVVASPVAKHRL